MSEKKQNYGDVLFSSYNQIFRVISGPLTIILIPVFLSEIEQGYWFTFISIAGLSVFANLGFTGITSQFAAHEFAYLEIKEGIIQGPSIHKNRLGSLFKYISKWLLLVFIVVFPLITIAGLLLLNTEDDRSGISWLIPWIIYSFGSGLIFIVSGLSAFFQGCDQVKQIQKIQLVSSIIYLTLLVILFNIGCGLYTLGIATLIKSLLLIYLIFRKYKYLVRDILNSYRTSMTTTNWNKEILPLLGKYAISWVSGYFIFQIYTPITFKYFGAVEAGKVGFSISIFTAIFSLAGVWVTAKKPLLNFLIARKEFKEADILIIRQIKYSLFSYVIILFFGIFSLTILENLFHLNFSERIVSGISFTILSIGWFCQIILNSVATYLRSHKIEPMMKISIFIAIYNLVVTGIFTLIISNVDFLFIGFLSSFFLIIYPLKKLLVKTKLDFQQ